MELAGLLLQLQPPTTGGDNEPEAPGYPGYPGKGRPRSRWFLCTNAVPRIVPLRVSERLSDLLYCGRNAAKVRVAAPCKLGRRELDLRDVQEFLRSNVKPTTKGQNPEIWGPSQKLK
eukprot:1279259-Rhodomonas_salina.1